MSAGIAWRDISDPDELTALEPQWWTLWRHCATATPFQSPAWLLPWWDAFAPGPLRAIAGWSGARLVALAPFYLGTGTLGRRLLPLGISLSGYQDILVENGEPAILAALADQMAESCWDACVLTEVRDDA